MDEDAQKASETLFFGCAFLWAIVAFSWSFLLYAWSGIVFPSADDFAASPLYCMFFVGIVYGIPVSFLAWNLIRKMRTRP